MESILVTDSCCDLPYDYVKENNIEVVSLKVTMGSESFNDDLGQTISYGDFYRAIREGSMPSTSQANTFVYKEVFEKYIKEDKEVIYIGFSSALSGCYNSARLAQGELMEEYENAKIHIIDSKSASLGLGLLVYYANSMIKEGVSPSEVVEFVENNKLKVNHYFTVDDLNHLHRGGRVSKTAATIGTMLNVKPIMHVDDEGRLIPLYKVKGRRKSIKTLFEEVEKNIVNKEDQVLAISHGDCLEEALHLKDMLTQNLKIKDVIINHVGAAIGSHSGPGTIAVFFLGSKR